MTGSGARARTLAVKCYVEANDDPAAAAELLAKSWPKGMGPLPRQPKEFIKRHATKFFATGTVADAPRSGRPPKLTKAQAAKAAKVFGAGYRESTQRVKGEPPVEEPHGFGGIKDALRRSAPLRKIQAKSGASPKTLFRAVLKANPKIKRHPRDRKAAKSVAARRVRQAGAKEWLLRSKDRRWAWVKSLVFLDEGCIVVEHGPKRREYEYFDESKDAWRYALSHPLVKVKGGITLWFYIAVNAVTGAVCIYFTTGTTDLKRLYVGKFPDPPGGFKTLKRGKAKRVTGAECTHCVFPAIMWEVDQLVQAGKLDEAVYSFDYAPAHRAAARVYNVERGATARAPGAPKSPDMNAPAEHTISFLRTKFFAAAEAAGFEKLTGASAQKLLTKVFWEQVTAASVKKDVERLFSTMRVIAADEGVSVRCKGNKVMKGTGGDWAPRGLR